MYIDNKSNDCTKHNYKLDQIRVCNHWHQLPSLVIRQLTYRPIGLHNSSAAPSSNISTVSTPRPSRVSCRAETPARAAPRVRSHTSRDSHARSVRKEFFKRFSSCAISCGQYLKETQKYAKFFGRKRKKCLQIQESSFIISKRGFVNPQEY